MLLMFVVNAFNINPKIKQIVPPQSTIILIVMLQFMFLNTIRSHLKDMPKTDMNLRRLEYRPDVTSNLTHVHIILAIKI